MRGNLVIDSLSSNIIIAGTVAMGVGWVVLLAESSIGLMGLVLG